MTMQFWQHNVKIIFISALIETLIIYPSYITAHKICLNSDIHNLFKTQYKELKHNALLKHWYVQYNC